MIEKDKKMVIVATVSGGGFSCDKEDKFDGLARTWGPEEYFDQRWSSVSANVDWIKQVIEGKCAAKCKECCIIEKGIDYRGKDILVKKTKDQQECADLSASTPGGLFWILSTKTKNCYIRNSNSKKTKVGHAVSGNKECAKVK